MAVVGEDVAVTIGDAVLALDEPLPDGQRDSHEVVTTELHLAMT